MRCVNALYALILGANFMKKRFYEGFLLKGCFENCLKNCFKGSFTERFTGSFSIPPFKEKLNENMESAKNHLNKYLNDLKLHFDLTENDIQKILITIYRKNKPQNPFVKCLSMLKYWS